MSEQIQFGGKVSASDSGAAAELMVAADLIDRGFDVFRNLSPNGPIDLVVLAGGKLYRVQVKRGGGCHSPQNGPNGFDVFAHVGPEGIEYCGDLPINTQKRRQRCEGRVLPDWNGGGRCRQWALVNKRFCRTHERQEQSAPVQP